MNKREIDKANLKYAYSCAVEAHQKFEENHSSVENATLAFELVSGVTWEYQGNGRGGYIGYTEKPDEFDPDNPEYGFEVNWIQYQDDKCIHLDCDGGCGSRHISLVFLKSEEFKAENDQD